MADNKQLESQKDYKPQSMGNIWTDRLFSEFPYMKGWEVSEEEFQEWKKKEGL